MFCDMNDTQLKNCKDLDFIKYFLKTKPVQNVFSNEWIIENLGYEYIYYYQGTVNKDFEKMINLKYAHLKDIEYIPILPVSLVHLKIIYPKFETLPNHIFDNLPNLTKLSITYGNLTILQEHIFDKLTNLKYLYLFNNKLETLSEHIFDKLINLKQLYLFNNKFQVLPDTIFDKLNLEYYSSIETKRFINNVYNPIITNHIVS